MFSFFVIGSTVRAFEADADQATSPPPQADANTCVTCHQQKGDETVALFAPSTHAKAGLTCNRCHGGDAKSGDQAAAHAPNFIGKPTASESLAMCGTCHTSQLAAFKASMHVGKQANAISMTCSDCHGAHMVGSFARDFSFALYCTNCHGLEYVRALPAEFMKLLALADEEKDLLARLAAAGRKPSLELLARRKEIRRRLGAIIHATDMRGGLEKQPQLLKLGDEFKTMVESERK
jgi:cytochrome c553